MEYKTYRAQLQCGHIQTTEKSVKAGDCSYCVICNIFAKVLMVYEDTREVDDIEEMME